MRLLPRRLLVGVFFATVTLADSVESRAGHSPLSARTTPSALITQPFQQKHSNKNTFSMEPTKFERAKVGAMMGGAVGLCIGLVFGGISAMR